MAVQATFVYKYRDGSFSYSTPMEVIPRVGEHIDIPDLGGDFKIRKIVWRETRDKDVWGPHLELRKPFTSEF
jgi:hypothetical protein